MPACGFRGDTRDKFPRNKFRVDFRGDLRGVLQNKYRETAEHGRAQARVLSGLLSRMLPLLARVIISMSNRFLSGRRGGRDVVEHPDSRRFLTFSIREYILSSHTTEQPTAENYPSKACTAIDRTIHDRITDSIISQFMLSCEKNVSRFPF